MLFSMQLPTKKYNSRVLFLLASSKCYLWSESFAMETKAFFENLDKEFIGLDRIVDETFYYKGADVLVQSTWELPIIIQWPGSTLKFEFSTAQGLFQLIQIATLDYPVMSIME